MNEFQNQIQRITDWWYELNFSTLQKRGLLVLGGLVIIISGFWVTSGKSEAVIMAEPIEIEAPLVTVDVAGAVTNPGVYALPGNARVIDAIKAAGNSLAGTDLSDLNLARIIRDGEQIYVSPTEKTKIPVGRKFATKKATPTGPLNINRATAKQFEKLDGVGPVLAKRIVAYRAANGPFITLEDLDKVSGIGPAKFAQFKSQITV
jgi:competence protein ComEA